MKVSETTLSGVLLIEPNTFIDDRGFFLETYHAGRYAEAGIAEPFLQDNQSFSKAHVLRGLHLQFPIAQGKLIYVVQGEVFDVAVDVRVGSPTFAQWMGASLSSENRRQVYIPEGFAHGFCVVSETALVAYKCTDIYRPEMETAILWSDPDIGIDWPIDQPVISPKDAAAACLKDINEQRLPRYAGAD